MRVLIVGDFSSFSKNLSPGFRALGHECFVFSWGDGFKKITQGSNSYTVSPPIIYVRLFKKIFKKLSVFYATLKLRRFVYEMSKKEKWDVILIINPIFINKTLYDYKFSKRMFLSLVSNPDNIFLEACGGDVPYYDYWITQDWKNKQQVLLHSKKRLNKSERKHFEYYSSFINKVIPMSYTYAEAWRKSVYAQSKSFLVCPTIPAPIDTSQNQPYNEIGEKIVIFHGIVRPKDKGTEYIVKAMEKLQQTYPSLVECHAKGGLPLNEYLELLKRTNILIDQTYACSTGMNALYALAMGKVVLGGNEPENSIEFNYPNIPVINIGPDSEQIFKELEYLIHNPSVIMKLSREGRKYVESLHDSKIVAQKFIETFKKFGTELS